jgi:general secretion pathway protein F
MRFYYRVRNAAGEQQSGTLEAPSRLAALRRLAGAGWQVEYCDARPPSAAVPPPAPARPRYMFVSLYFFRPWPGHLASFYHQLGQLLGAGISPYEAALSLAQRAPTRPLRLAMSQIAPRLATGASLAEEMACYPQLFPPETVGLLRAAERSGDWEAICRELEAWYLEIYRGLLWFMVARLYYTAVVLAGLVVWLRPTLLAELVTAGWNLRTVPGAGLAVLGWLGRWCLLRLLPAVALVASVALLWRWLAGLPQLGPWRARLALWMPLYAALERRAVALRFLRALASLVHAGVEVPEAFALAGEATGNAVAARCVREVAEMLRPGASVEQAAERLFFLTPPQRAVLCTAFQAGRLEEGLAHLLSTTREAAAHGLRLVRLSQTGLTAVAVTIFAFAAFLRGWLWLYRYAAEKAGVSDLWQELWGR